MTGKQVGGAVRSSFVRLRDAALASALLGLATLLLPAAPAHAQLIPCPDPIDLSKQKLPEIVSNGGRLRGMVVLWDTQQAFQVGTGKCVPQLLRFYQNHEPAPPDPNKAMAPLPGPTLRARLGDVVELTFLNQIDPLDYGDSIDRWENLKTDPSVPGAGCDASTAGYPTLPRTPPTLVDSMPDCFHGSSTGNIHFHGTHTSPQSTADDVFIGVRPSPRENGKPTVTAATVQQAFDEFFAKCEQVLKADNLAEWPKVWADLPTSYTTMQEKLLKEYDQGRPPQMQLWPVDAAQIAAGQWPQYYVGAFPNCFVLPKYPGVVPAHPGMSMPMGLHMGQAPGTHWYHAHKHGSTFLNVSNGMAGAFIIEGDEYDGKLNAFYNRYRSDKSSDWTRQQPTLVVNQLGTTPGLERGGGTGAPPFAVNGQQQPTLTMYPGQVMLWRIVNASATSGFYLPALPAGFTWRQTAQDGVQFDDQNYQRRAQRPVFVASGNRIDLLVRAPSTPAPAANPVTVSQGVSVSVAENSPPTAILLTVVLAGSGPAMPLMPHAPPRPVFLHDITPAEVGGHTRSIEFETVNKGGQREHTINHQKFQEGAPLEIKPLNTVEEWTLVNSTVVAKVDHPFHIHLNPFQIIEVFDPNAPLLDSHGVPVKDPGGTVVPLFVIQTAQPQLKPGQCWVNPDNKATWKPCTTSPQTTYPGNDTNIWWDVFPIPAGVSATNTAGQSVIIPGYFKMRSRFVDYAGSYVMHCHILAHEDRGMMMQINLAVTTTVPLAHH
jgi:FtsP/CotA-like multicopper oxidase with cupredoxin domain